MSEIVSRDELLPRVAVLAESLAANSPESMRATKALLVAQSKSWLDPALALSLKANAEARRTHDFREGVAAFLEKRPPVWQADPDKLTE